MTINLEPVGRGQWLDVRGSTLRAKRCMYSRNTWVFNHNMILFPPTKRNAASDWQENAFPLGPIWPEWH
jgi:hypothetical protein